MNRIKFEGVYKEDGNRTILHHIDFQIGQGKSMVIKCTEDIALVMMDMILGKLTPSKGHIYLEGKPPQDYMKDMKEQIAVIYKEEGFYDRLNIKDYLKFFHELYGSNVDIKETMSRFALLDIAHDKISSLNYSQKKRVSFARVLISEPRILLIQEPTLNLDLQSSLLIRESIVYMQSLGMTILSFSISLEDTLLLDGDSYTYNEKGLELIEEAIVHEENVECKDQSPHELDKMQRKISKIPAKIEDKIILFNPMEINYIESSDGASHIHVGNDMFPCSLTLSKLENRLKHFGFFRCHRSYLVNLQKVREVMTWTRNSYSLILDDHDKSAIPLSKGRMDELKQILDL